MDKKLIENIVETIKPVIAKDIKVDDKALDMVLAAYNRFQDDERNGVDYIFNIEDKDDLQYLVNNCDLTAQDIWRLVNNMGTNDYLPYFHLGENYPEPHFIGKLNDLQNNMIAWLDELLPFVLLYVTRCPEYQAIYEKYITEMLENEFSAY